MEENKILLYRWHLPKWALLVCGSCPSVVQTVNFVIVSFQDYKKIAKKRRRFDVGWTSLSSQNKLVIFGL